MGSAVAWRAIPYCGSPPSPDGLLRHWNLDPVLILAIALLAGLHLAGLVRAGAGGRTRMAAFSAGWVVAALALISPLCPLSVSLFAARVGQHMVLTLIAAPLIALARPDLALAGWLKRAQAVAPSGGLMPGVAAGVFAVMLWLWHAPQPYALTFQSTAVYWAMHLSVIGSAVWLWLALIRGFAAEGFKVAAIALASSIQMGFLGALITLAPAALYAPHALTTAAWGLPPLQDQQLGGAIMWIPGCLAFLAMAVAAMGFAMRRLDRRGPVAPPAPSTAGA